MVIQLIVCSCFQNIGYEGGFKNKNIPIKIFIISTYLRSIRVAKLVMFSFYLPLLKSINTFLKEIFVFEKLCFFQSWNKTGKCVSSRWLRLVQMCSWALPHTTSFVCPWCPGQLGSEDPKCESSRSWRWTGTVLGRGARLGMCWVTVNHWNQKDYLEEKEAKAMALWMLMGSKQPPGNTRKAKTPRGRKHVWYMGTRSKSSRYMDKY